jgi:hypothetical protein
VHFVEITPNGASTNADMLPSRARIYFIRHLIIQFQPCVSNNNSRYSHMKDNSVISKILILSMVSLDHKNAMFDKQDLVLTTLKHQTAK